MSNNTAPIMCITEHANMGVYITKYGSTLYTSKLKKLQIKKREYRDGIKSKETRPGWGEAHNVYKACVGTTEGF